MLLILQHIKLPPVEKLKMFSSIKLLPEIDVPCDFQEIRVQQSGPICFVYFDFYNGAMDKRQAGRLERILKNIAIQDSQIVVLMGGDRFFSTGAFLPISHMLGVISLWLFLSPLCLELYRFCYSFFPYAWYYIIFALPFSLVLGIISFLLFLSRYAWYFIVFVTRFSLCLVLYRFFSSFLPYTWYFIVFGTPSRKHSYIGLTPLNPTFI